MKTKTVYEYLGCAVHGCPECQDGDKLNRFGISNSEAHRRIVRRCQRLVTDTFRVDNVIVRWSCQWNRIKEASPRIRKFLEDNPIPNNESKLGLRTGFRGGYVDPSSVYADSKKISQKLSQIYGMDVPEQPGLFLDFTSQYPSTLIHPSQGPSDNQVDYAPIPVKYPRTLFGNTDCREECSLCCLGDCQCDVETLDIPKCEKTRKCRRMDDHDCLEGVNCYFVCSRHHPPSDWGKAPGMAQVKMLPPRSERFPILRVSMEHKEDKQIRNYCTLCRTCAQELHPHTSKIAECNHSQEERCIYGVYTLHELKYAIEVQKYRVMAIQRIVYYPNHRFDLFHRILATFAFQKITCDGFPCDDMTVEEKENYVKTLSEDTGFTIKVTDIRKAPALRLLGKICLNALIGKSIYLFPIRNYLLMIVIVIVTGFIQSPDLFF